MRFGLVAVAALIALALGAALPLVYTADAHVHPLNPSNDCAPSSTAGNPNVGAGNESDPQNPAGRGQTFIPGYIPNANPGSVETSNGVAANPAATTQGEANAIPRCPK